MQYRAESKNIKISPRKVRLVADSVRELKLAQALVSLSVQNKRAATPIRKALESAVANAVNNFNANRDDLMIKEIMVGEGVTLKRYHYAARGRVRPYLKRTSHIYVTLEDQIVRSAAPEVAKEAKAEPVEAKADVKAKKKTSKEKKGDK